MPRIAIIQTRMSANPAENLDGAVEKIRAAAAQGAEVVCLPELFQSRYFCQTEDYAPFDLAEPVPGPTTKRLETVCAETGVTLIASLFEERARGLYHNTAAVIDGPAGYLGKYRKMHIPDDPRYYEKFYFTPGDLGFKSFHTRHGTLGVLICWDQWYPEAARLTALRGADILFYPTAIGWHPEERDTHGAAQHEAWQMAQRAHAIANGCFVVAVNRVGFEPEPGGEPGAGIQFWGRSFAAGPDGQLLAEAPSGDEAILLVDIDLNRITELRQGWPFLRDRRIDAYDELSRRFID